MGLNRLRKLFQHIMDQMLQGIEGATAVMDVILIGERDGIKPDPTKVRALVEIPRPKDKEE